MTIFRGELGGWFLVMFISLLVGKVWGWIGEGRVEFLEQQPPSNPRLFHARLAISLILSVLFNSFMLEYCAATVLQQARPDMMVMFGFEFAVLVILSSSTAARYAIALTEIYITRQQVKARIEERRTEIRAAREEATLQHALSERNVEAPVLPSEDDIDEVDIDVPGWEEKGRWIFYLDLATDFLKLTVYLTFFAILTAFYGLPIHILRDVVVTIRSFGKRIVDFVRYRHATRDMNERYPDATVDDIGQDDVCIICREQMTPWERPGPNGGASIRTGVPDRLRPKKLPCGHILHFSCLRSWLERQQNCPTCRRPVIMPARSRGANAQPNGPAGDQAGGRNGDPAGALPRARIYQFGPFRIGFGAGRADVIQNLQQQFNRVNVPGANVPAHDPQQQRNAQPGPRGQHVGVGLSFGRQIGTPAAQAAPVQANTDTHTTSQHSLNVSSAQEQLQQMEEQITHEINSLHLAAEQLQIVRLLQAELQRLRALQVNPVNPTFPGLSASSPSQSSSILPSSIRRPFIPDASSPVLGAGDTRLPEGLTIPPGWTLVPLQSTEPTRATSASEPLFSAPSATPTMTSDVHPQCSHGRDENGGNENANNHVPRAPPQELSSSTHADASDNPFEPSRSSRVGRNDGQSSMAGAQEQEETLNHDDLPSSSEKGKGRAATVEDVADEES